MKNRVITISREFGSGGRTIGKEVAARLGIPCYDQEIITEVVKESGLAKEYIEDMGEHTKHRTWLANAFSGSYSYQGFSTQDYLWEVQRNVILDLANKESCVIVGRCADYILSECADCLKIFIHADMENRAERIVTLYGEREEAPIKRLTDKDKRRSAYYHYYTDLDWGDARNYHMTLDSGVLGIQRCVELLVDLY